MTLNELWNVALVTIQNSKISFPFSHFFFFLEKHRERKLPYTNFIIILMKSNKEEKGRAYLVGITLELK